jgi:hypothetical protein
VSNEKEHTQSSKGKPILRFISDYFSIPNGLWDSILPIRIRSGSSPDPKFRSKSIKTANWGKFKVEKLNISGIRI